MAETYGPFDTVAWSQAQWYRFAASWAPSGVLDTPQTSLATGGLAVTASGLTLSLAAGRAWVRGAGYENDATKTISVTANATGNARIDRLVLRRDLSAKTVTTVVVQGTPAASPVAPALTQVETGQWDVSLCQWRTPASSGTTLTNFVDERVWIDADYTLGRFGGLTLVKLTQAAYDALSTKDAATLYVIVG
jgi:hypothetical protein